MCPNLDFGCPELEDVFGSFTEKINRYIEDGKLPADTQATMVIEDWQRDLKKVTFRLTWVDKEQKSQEYSREVFLHAGHEAE